ncbi:F-box/WD repeat-containing protein 10 [Kryptolebias marmoratus]|uniref:F-box/WD repeat-containing protein 10 n=1 Tax=Kryptolebias marmoratus TaxID=37003 RepID=UPI0018AD0A48|nr:F-box/WD repeat-containing protein 10 [Kryptolebias marmoratus]
MKPAKVGGDVPASESNDAGCVLICGMCPACVFSPPPGSAGRPWTVSDEFRRRFVVALLSRCGSVKQLESIHASLSGTSWPWLTYARSRRSPQEEEDSLPRRPQGKPPGVDTGRIWSWFNSSPDWMKTRYLCRIFSLCDFELLRMLCNLTSVLIVRRKRGFQHFNVGSHNPSQQESDPDDPALMVVPGSSKSVSGVSQYRDFVSCLPVNLSKRILGLLEEHTLRHCQKVCRYWQHLTEETMEEIKFRRSFKEQHEAIMKVFCRVNTPSPTYANIVEVPVPVDDEEKDDVHPTVQIGSFEAAHAKSRTKPVQMEERNVFCGAYFTKVLLKESVPSLFCTLKQESFAHYITTYFVFMFRREYHQRVLDYRGGFLMATSSKDRLVRLLCVASETKTVAAMKGRGAVRAVQLCEDRDLLITAGCDECIRCWNLKTDTCEAVLCGHTGTINCLDVQADRLVSGAKDCCVKVWSLRTRSLFTDFDFSHLGSVLCVKINKSAVYSSCDRGLVKIWNLETASLLRVINAHRSSVKCLFVNNWHLLSGDSSGKVMAWSVSCEAGECLMTFRHPKQVKSLTLLYLRVITGCLDGKIRVFNFLTGECLREIQIEQESGSLLSLHVHDHSILVNVTSCVQLYQFDKVFWDYTPPTQGGGGNGVAQDGLISERAADLCRKRRYTSIGKRAATSPAQKIVDSDSLKPERREFVQQTHFLSVLNKSHPKGNSESVKQSVIKSEKAACERIRKRGPHHPPTRDAILLRISAIQRALRTDEVSVNMERNARLRDSWGPQTPQDRLDLSADKQNLQSRPKTCLPILRQAASQSLMNSPQSREVSTAPASAKTQPHRGNAHGRFPERQLDDSKPRREIEQSKYVPAKMK